MILLSDRVVDILRNYFDAYVECRKDEREIYAARLVGALDMALATAEVKDGD